MHRPHMEKTEDKKQRDQEEGCMDTLVDSRCACDVVHA